MTISTEQLIAAARSWIGVPFHHQGRSRHGVDCAGLPIAILEELGELPKQFRLRANYGRYPTAELVEELTRWCVPATEPAPGTLVTIRWPHMTMPSHLAICTGPDIIHAYRPGVICSAYRGRWRNATSSVWRLPGVTYE